MAWRGKMAKCRCELGDSRAATITADGRFDGLCLSSSRAPQPPLLSF
jgi:hypothetical protein